jgi:hypothetical protein
MGEVHMNEGRVVEDRRIGEVSKWMDVPLQVCALSTLHYFTHNIYPEVPKGCTLQNKGLARLFQHANHDVVISMYKGHKHVPSPPGQPREQ